MLVYALERGRPKSASASRTRPRAEGSTPGERHRFRELVLAELDIALRRFGAH